MLIKEQRNDLFKVLVQEGVTDCELIDRPESGSPLSRDGYQIHHRLTSSVFDFNPDSQVLSLSAATGRRLRSEKLVYQYSFRWIVADGRSSGGSQPCQDWAELLAGLADWAREVRNHADTPDLWTQVRGHAFISSVREDRQEADRLQQAFQAAGIPVWRGITDLQPGQDWKLSIRRAISSDALAFIACFSRTSAGKTKSYQNEELLLAIEEFRQHPPGRQWLIPVRFDDCDIPDFDLGGGRTLASIQRADLFGDIRADQSARLIQAIRHIVGHAGQPRRPPAASGSAAPGTDGVLYHIADPDGQRAHMRAADHYGLANQLHSAGRLAEAGAEYRQAIRMAPGNGGYRYAFARSLRDAGKHSEAEAEYREATRLAPGNAGYRYALAGQLHDAGKLEDAEAEYREATRLAPGNAGYHYALALRLHDAGKLEDAEAEYREAVGLDPDHTGYRHALGLLLRDTRRQPEAN